MFIQTESTANPDVMKFLPGRTVLAEGSMSFRDPDDARRSPLAETLFRVPSVVGVSFDTESITVAKGPGADWTRLKPAVLGVIMEHFIADRPVLSDAQAAAVSPDDGAMAEIEAQITDLLKTRIKPALERTGAEIAYLGFEGGVVKLSSDALGVVAPMRAGIENILRHYVPEVQVVRFVEHRPSYDDNVRAGKAGLNSPAAKTIYELLDQEINPAVASHGGHIALVDVKDDTAFIRLEGGCQGCGMADVTLKQGVETAIKRAVPSIIQVLDTTDHAGGTNPYYQPGKSM